MATQTFGAGVPVLPVIILLVFITSPMAEAGADMRLSIGNVMQQTVNIHCYSNVGADLGPHTIRTSIGWYSFTVPSSGYAHDKYTCQFESAGKPLTNIEVFVGVGGGDNMPCHCSGSDCIWIIEDRGISCNLDKYFHGWGASLN